MRRSWRPAERECPLVLFSLSDGCAIAAQLRREAEFDMLFLAVHRAHLNRRDAAECCDDVVDKSFGCRRAGGEADGVLARDPFRLQFAAIGQQIAWNAFL